MRRRNNNVRVFCFIPLFLLFTSCQSPDECVCIIVVNKTTERVYIYSGFIIPESVDKKSESVISVGKGNEVSAKGEDTKSDYGSRFFYNDGERWVIP